MNIPTSILFNIPDYRVRVSNLTISGRDVKLEVETKIPYEDLIVRYYADWETHSVYVAERYYAMHSPELAIRDGYVEHSFEDDFEYVLGLIMDKNSGETLDYRGYNFGYGSQEGVTIELQELEVREIIRRGENARAQKDGHGFFVEVKSFGDSLSMKQVGWNIKYRNQLSQLPKLAVVPQDVFKVLEMWNRQDEEE